jgi:hypothetical protein
MKDNQPPLKYGNCVGGERFAEIEQRQATQPSASSLKRLGNHSPLWIHRVVDRLVCFMPYPGKAKRWFFACTPH